MKYQLQVVMKDNDTIVDKIDYKDCTFLQFTQSLNDALRSGFLPVQEDHELMIINVSDISYIRVKVLYG